MYVLGWVCLHALCPLGMEPDFPGVYWFKDLTVAKKEWQAYPLYLLQVLEKPGLGDPLKSWGGRDPGLLDIDKGCNTK